jgi:uncharacterized membrane protein YidH (DUF202 family)
MRLLGIVLVVLGVIGLAYGGISWTRQKKVVDVGPVELSTEQRERLPISPIAGGACLVAGVALLVIRPR